MSGTKQRIEYIDLAKGICIVFTFYVLGVLGTFVVLL